jgi:hypothetical protein
MAGYPMASQSRTTGCEAFRKLGSVPWFHQGCDGLAVTVRPDVPSFDEWMIRDALLRGAETCDQLKGLDRAINRELWPLGYVARLDGEAGEGGAVVVEVAPRG